MHTQQKHKKTAQQIKQENKNKQKQTADGNTITNKKNVKQNA